LHLLFPIHLGYFIYIFIEGGTYEVGGKFIILTPYLNIRAVKLRRMRQIGHVACMGEEGHAHEVFELSKLQRI